MPFGVRIYAHKQVILVGGYKNGSVEVAALKVGAEFEVFLLENGLEGHLRSLRDRRVQFLG